MHASVSIPAHLQSAIASVIEQMADVSPPTQAGWSGGGKLIGAEGGDTGASGGGGVGGGIGDSISDSGGDEGLGGGGEGGGGVGGSGEGGGEGGGGEGEHSGIWLQCSQRTVVV